MDVIRRTFEAAQHPKGSEERARLNEDARTSEYMPSYRYLTSDGTSHRTKREAEQHALLAGQHGELCPECHKIGDHRSACSRKPA